MDFETITDKVGMEDVGETETEGARTFKSLDGYMYG